MDGTAFARALRQKEGQEVEASVSVAGIWVCELGPEMQVLIR